MEEVKFREKKEKGPRWKLTTSLTCICTSLGWLTDLSSVKEVNSSFQSDRPLNNFLLLKFNMQKWAKGRVSHYWMDTGGYLFACLVGCPVLVFKVTIPFLHGSTNIHLFCKIGHQLTDQYYIVHNFCAEVVSPPQRLSWYLTNGFPKLPEWTARTATYTHMSAC